MRALFCERPHQLSWRDVPAPVVRDPQQALVRPIVVATCDIDAPMIAGETPYRGPIGLGHECIAEVVEVGDDVRRVQRGDRVVVPFQISCGRCAPCRRGTTGNCSAGRGLSMYGFGAAGGDVGGAFADLLLVPYADAMLELVPPQLDVTHYGSLADNLPDAYRAVAGPLARNPGATVLVVGGECVSIGLYSVMLARALGAGEVMYLDRDEDRGERARRLGAWVTVDDYPAKAARRFDITVDASADERGLACALRSTAPDGVCTSTGGYFTDTTPVPLRDFYLSCGTFVTGRCHARPAIAPLLALASAGKLAPDVVTARVCALEDAHEALAEGKREKLAFVRRASFAAAALMALLVPWLAPRSAVADEAAAGATPRSLTLDLQVDPTPFFLSGFAVEAGLGLGRHRVMTTAIAYDVPDFIEEDDRFDERRQLLLGVGYQFDVLGGGHGPFAGGNLTYTRSRFTLLDTGGAAHADTFKSTFRFGWTFRPLDSVPSLFLAPWLGPSVSWNPSTFTVDGVRIDRRPVGVTGAIQLGWAFAL
jgi:threonine dehydrogenase-like Zn-dependent dehydrogenase